MVRTINEWLSTLGKNPNGEPFFRIVWSDEERELRRGTFNEFLGPIFLRTVTGVRWCRKYPTNKERFILEVWLPPELSFTEELPNSRSGVYELGFVFEDGNGEPLPLSLKAVEFMISTLTPNLKNPQLIKSQILEEENRKEERINNFIDEMVLHS